MSVRVALAQINPTVGDLHGNREKILLFLEDATRLGADIVVFPEMSLTGYPAEDLLLKPDFVDCVMASLESIAPASRGITAIVGTLYRAEGDLYNGAAVLHDGQLAGVYRKQSLPNYGVFDEFRYFRAGDEDIVFVLGGSTFGVSICEDIWHPNGTATRQALEAGAELLINISASPYHATKGYARERMLCTRAADSTAMVAYCNLVGGQDELVFDGQSVISGPGGEIIARAKQFEEDLLIADLDMRQVFLKRLNDPRARNMGSKRTGRFSRVQLTNTPPSTARDRIAPRQEAQMEAIAEVYSALVLGTRDYVNKNRFRKVVLGLSGGIDSALTAVIAADALGSENVTGIAMPTRYSSPHSLEDAEKLARNSGLSFRVLSIDATFQSFLDLLDPVFAGRSPDIAEENLQARIRGTLLMALSNKFGWLVVTTGNKSEIAVGYSTLYGDTAGGFSIIKDVPKTLVYELARYRNRIAGRELIPQRVLDKAPSAELRPDQRDSDSLPEYVVLDAILQRYVEGNLSLAGITSEKFPESVVSKIVRMIDKSEYKRRQSPPGIKITSRAFGKDWRLPITNQYLCPGGLHAEAQHN